MKELLFSIIVPVYNSEKTLKRCLDSILSQSYKHFEVIIVNDGSTDNSGYICDYYCLRDDRLKCIHKVNEGVSYARNLGISKAKGDFLCFIDADDEYDSSMLKILYDSVQNNYCDIVIFGIKKLYTRNEEIVKIESDRCNKGEWTTKCDIKENIINLFPNMMIASLCNKAYRREIISHEKMCEMKTGEDYLFNINILPKVCHINCVEKELYNYYRPLDVETRSNIKDIDLIYDYIKMHEKTYELFFETWGVNDENGEIKNTIDNMMYGLYQSIILSALSTNNKKEIQTILKNKWIFRAIKNSKTYTFYEYIYKMLLRKKMLGTIRILLKVKGMKK